MSAVIQLHAPNQPTMVHNMVVASPAMRSLLSTAERVAQSSLPILLRGAAGTGKELLARAIHKWSKRANAPFQKIHCATITSPVELLGAVGGAVPGIERSRSGKFALAEGGTLYLDEVGDLSMALQAQLLRVLEDRSYMPVGAGKARWADIRLIAGSRHSLEQLVQQGKLRDDLMYRIQVLPLELPELVLRDGGVHALAMHFIDKNNRRDERQIEGISDAVLDLFNRYRWPANIRELQNVIEYAFAVGDGAELTIDELPSTFSKDSEQTLSTQPSGLTLDQLDRRRLLSALSQSGGRRSEAAEILGVSRTTLWRKLRHHNLLSQSA
ncbi:MAG TPA: sigma-54-dependent Fis family transcriptional regulator [Myxococcales bacterium]|nr:sigma-54-dependent Fis family transcriptional regulator [Myxococcales bacterium]HIN86520.1 sigma-54-dependent Fis family transcriptional regulator [Myxococcales bacterium]